MFGKIFGALRSGALGAKSLKVIADVTGSYPDKFDMESVNEMVARDAGIGVFANEYDVAFTWMLTAYLTESWITGEVRSDNRLQSRIFTQFDRCVEAGLITSNFTINEYATAKKKLLGS